MFKEENTKLEKKDPKVVKMLMVLPRPHEILFAERLVLLSAMPETMKAHAEKK